MNSLPRLTELSLEGTNACRHRCIHCSTDGGVAGVAELVQGDRLRVLREARDLGLVELRLLGGDPLMRLDDTLGLIDTAAQLGVRKVVIYTSAVENDLAWIESLLAFQSIRIAVEASIYAASPSIHDSITMAPGSLDRLLTNSCAALRLGLELTWLFVWMKPNASEMASVLALASEVGVQTVRILRLMPNGRARLNRLALEPLDEMLRLAPRVLADLAQRFPNVQLAYSKPLTFQLRAERQDTAYCSAGGRQLVIQADGLVLPCIGMKDRPSLCIGNVRTQSLREILMRSQSLGFGCLSQRFHECPAVLYQYQPTLIQLAS
jgi:MoaA/NifB/PqqE/SkfB family radical SAM enzyme